jgi:hypothetical protein
VVQTTKVEEPAPETGLGLFDSSQLHHRRSLSLSRTLSLLLPGTSFSSRKFSQQIFAGGFAR